LRHFIVLGFQTTDNSEQGQPVYLGTDRGQAIQVVNALEEGVVRKCLFEMATPHISRHFAKPSPKPEPPSEPEPETETEAEPETEPEQTKRKRKGK